MRAQPTGAVLTLALLLGLAGCHKSPPGEAPAIRFEPTASRLAAGGRDPQVVVRASGELFALWVQASEGGADLWLARSEDGGDHLGPARRLNTAPGGVRSHVGGRPRLLLGPRSELYAVWREDGGLKLSRSGDYGKSFGAPVDVPTGGRAPSFFNAEIAPDGRLVIAWLGPVEGRDTPPGTAFVSVLSTPDGQHFSAPLVVANGVCPCCRPALAFSSQARWFLAFRQVHQGIRDMALVASEDGGATWSAPARISDDGWRIDGCPHSGPALAVAGRALWVAWYSEAEGAPRLYWTRRGLDGSRFEPRRRLSGVLVDPNQPALAVHGAQVFAAFQARDPKARNGWGPVGIYLRALGGEAAPVRASDEAGSATAPVLGSLGAGRWWVAWTERGAGGSARLVRARVPAAAETASR
jgi:hypothetical protein